MLRSCYKSRMRLRPGGPEHQGEWKFCPEPPKFFPFPIAFSSGNWDASKPYAPTFGEVTRPTHDNWTNGGINPDCSGGLRGVEQWWSSGVPWSADNRFCYPASGGFTLFGSAGVRVIVANFLSQENHSLILQEDGSRIFVS